MTETEADAFTADFLRRVAEGNPDDPFAYVLRVLAFIIEGGYHRP